MQQHTEARPPRRAASGFHAQQATEYEIRALTLPAKRKPKAKVAPRKRPRIGGSATSRIFSATHERDLFSAVEHIVRLLDRDASSSYAAAAAARSASSAASQQSQSQSQSPRSPSRAAERALGPGWHSIACDDESGRFFGRIDENGKRQGLGRMEWSAGDDPENPHNSAGHSYSGQWVDDQASGIGRYINVDRLKPTAYDGEFRNDDAHGVGRIVSLKTGDLYVGQWRENEKSGWGQETYGAKTKKRRSAAMKKHAAAGRIPANDAMSQWEGLWQRGQRVGIGFASTIVFVDDIGAPDAAAASSTSRSDAALCAPPPGSSGGSSSSSSSSSSDSGQGELQRQLSWMEYEAPGGRLIEHCDAPADVAGEIPFLLLLLYR